MARTYKLYNCNFTTKKNGNQVFTFKSLPDCETALGLAKWIRKMAEEKDEVKCTINVVDKPRSGVNKSLPSW